MGGDFEELPVFSAQQDHRLAQHLSTCFCCLCSGVRQLPRLPSTLFALNAAKVFADPSVSAEGAHGPAHVRRMECARLGDAIAGDGVWNHEAVRMFHMLQQMQQDAILDRHRHLRQVGGHRHCSPFFVQGFACIVVLSRAQQHHNAFLLVDVQ